MSKLSRHIPFIEFRFGVQDGCMPRGNQRFRLELNSAIKYLAGSREDANFMSRGSHQPGVVSYDAFHAANGWRSRVMDNCNFHLLACRPKKNATQRRSGL